MCIPEMTQNIGKTTGRVYKNHKDKRKRISFIGKNIPRKEECKHRWRVGSHNGIFKGKKIIKNSLNIWCEKCGKHLVAYYFPRGF